MRKPRDYDAELKALDDKARQLKRRKVEQLGEFVVATGADALSIEELAGALLVAAATSDTAKKEAWRQRGSAFFSRARHTPRACSTGAGRSAASARSATACARDTRATTPPPGT